MMWITPRGSFSIEQAPYLLTTWPPKSVYSLYLHETGKAPVQRLLTEQERDRVLQAATLS